MIEPKPIHPEEVYPNYVDKFLRLSLFYALNRFFYNEVVSKVRTEKLYHILTETVDIYRHTDLWDGNWHPAYKYTDPSNMNFLRWEKVVHELRPVFYEAVERRTANFRGGVGHRWQKWKTDQEFEDKAMATLKVHVRKEPSWAGWFDALFSKTPNWRSSYIKNDMDNLEQMRMPDPHLPRLQIQLTNDIQPLSPLDEGIDLTAIQLWHVLMNETIRDRVRPVELVQTCSWVNSHKRFQELFPAVWREGAIIYPDDEVQYWHMAFWGQFMDRRGDFNDANGDAMRKEGRFPYPCVKCEAPIEEVISHLNMHPRWRELLNKVQKTGKLPINMKQLQELKES